MTSHYRSAAKDRLIELLALPYNPDRDLEPFFTALKDYCREPPSQQDSDKPKLHRATYALHDVLREPPITAEELPRVKEFGYPFNALPNSYFVWLRKQIK